MRKEIVKRPSLGRRRSGGGALKFIGMIIFIGLMGMACESTADAAETPDAPFAAVNGNAYVASILTDAQQIDWLRALHGDDMPVVCRALSEFQTICAPGMDNDSSPIVGGVEEDGSATYADGSQYDPDTATWN